MTIPQLYVSVYLSKTEVRSFLSSSPDEIRAFLHRYFSWDDTDRYVDQLIELRNSGRRFPNLWLFLTTTSAIKIDEFMG